MKKQILISTTLLATALFFGCEETIAPLTSSSNDSNSIRTLKSGEALSESKCDSAYTGQLIFVPDSAAVYFCNGEEWNSINGKDGKDGENGDDGKDGENGKNGNDGQKGEPGDRGINGGDCFIQNDSAGIVTLRCMKKDESYEETTLYKAMCEQVPYDPANAACYSGELYSCDNKPYNPKENVCFEDKLFSCDESPEETLTCLK